LAKWEFRSTVSDKIRQKLRDYLHDTNTTPTDTKPPIPHLYSRDFNIVDKFIKIRKLIKYKPRIKSEAMRVLIGLLENAAVEIWVLEVDWKGSQHPDIREDTIRNHTKQLGMALQELSK
jgi:hypothetical protein